MFSKCNITLKNMTINYSFIYSTKLIFLCACSLYWNDAFVKLNRLYYFVNILILIILNYSPFHINGPFGVTFMFLLLIYTLSTYLSITTYTLGRLYHFFTPLLNFFRENVIVKHWMRRKEGFKILIRIIWHFDDIFYFP